MFHLFYKYLFNIYYAGHKRERAMNKIDKVHKRKLQVKMDFWCAQRNEQLELDVLVEFYGHLGTRDTGR